MPSRVNYCYLIRILSESLINKLAIVMQSSGFLMIKSDLNIYGQKLKVLLDLV